VKLIVSGGWIIDESTAREVILIAGLGDITQIKIDSEESNLS
jgi:hypothetical protein